MRFAQVFSLPFFKIMLLSRSMEKPPTDPSLCRTQRFHRRKFKIKPESLTRLKKAQRKNKKYYKWMVEENPRTAKRHPQMNKSRRRKTKSEFILMAERIESTPVGTKVSTRAA